MPRNVQGAFCDGAVTSTWPSWKRVPALTKMMGLRRLGSLRPNPRRSSQGAFPAPIPKCGVAAPDPDVDPDLLN